MASSLVKSVCLTQRTGLSPRTRKSGSRFFSSRRILKPDSLTARGRSTGGWTFGGAAASVSRAAWTISAMAKPSWRRPSWLVAEISKTR